MIIKHHSSSTHWGRMTHTWFKLVQKMACRLLGAMYYLKCWFIVNRTLRKKTSVLIKVQSFSFTKMHLKISSGQWQPFYTEDMGKFSSHHQMDYWLLLKQANSCQSLFKSFVSLECSGMHQKAAYIFRSTPWFKTIPWHHVVVSRI